MKVPLVVLPEARLDLVDGRTFLERKGNGMGDTFLDEVLEIFDQIASMPEIYGEIDLGVRAAALPRFGYVVYFRLLPTEIEVVAVLHGRRDASVWKNRIR